MIPEGGEECCRLSSEKSHDSQEPKKPSIPKGGHKKKVRFCRQVKVRTIAKSVPGKFFFNSPFAVSKRQDEDSVNTKLWYSPRDFQKMRTTAIELVDRVKSGQIGVGGQKYCIRGLEKMFHKEEILEVRRRARNAVLQEQDLQLHEERLDSLNDERIAYLYHTESKQALTEAILRGEEDAQSIKWYIESDT